MDDDMLASCVGSGMRERTLDDRQRSKEQPKDRPPSATALIPKLAVQADAGEQPGSARAGSSRLKSGNLAETAAEIAPRIKEVFQQYDKDRSGSLDKDEIAKVLKTLGPSFSTAEIARWSIELDPSNDGEVSVKEFMDWIRKGTEGARMVFSAIKSTSDKRAIRIKETFARYDKSGDGSLDIEEMRQTLRNLGSFNIEEIRHVCGDLDKDKDGEISFEEFEAWIRSPSKKKEIMKAKAILAPSDNDGLEAVFYNFCGQGRADMDNKGFLKLLRDCGLLDKKFTDTVVDLLFANPKLKPKGERSIGFEQFELALELVAEKKGVRHKDVLAPVMEVTRPMMQGTKAEAVKFHDDKSTYTGAHGGGISSEPKPPGARSQAQIERVRSLKKANRKPPQVSLDTVIDNSQLWKVFGAQTKAGLTLKRLYSPPPSPTPAFRGSRPHSKTGGDLRKGQTTAGGAARTYSGNGVGMTHSMSMPNISKPWDQVPGGGLSVRPSSGAGF